jgi:1-acyl-sn-glycerol-3-phosphate acyltransferase
VCPCCWCAAVSGLGSEKLAGRAAHSRNIGALLARAAYRVEVHGRHHVPAHGPALLVGSDLNLFSAALVGSVACRPIHTLAPWALAQLGDIPVFPPGIAAAQWALELLEAGAAIMVTADVPPLGYLLAHGSVPITPVVVIGGSGKIAEDPPRLRSKIEVYFCAPSTIAPSASEFDTSDPCAYRVVQGLSERVRQLTSDARNESARRSGRPVIGRVH